MSEQVRRAQERQFVDSFLHLCRCLSAKGLVTDQRAMLAALPHPVPEVRRALDAAMTRDPSAHPYEVARVILLNALVRQFVAEQAVLVGPPMPRILGAPGAPASVPVARSTSLDAGAGVRASLSVDKWTVQDDDIDGEEDGAGDFDDGPPRRESPAIAKYELGVRESRSIEAAVAPLLNIRVPARRRELLHAECKHTCSPKCWGDAAWTLLDLLALIVRFPAGPSIKEIARFLSVLTLPCTECQRDFDLFRTSRVGRTDRIATVGDVKTWVSAIRQRVNRKKQLAAIRARQSGARGARGAPRRNSAPGVGRGRPSSFAATVAARLRAREERDPPLPIRATMRTQRPAGRGAPSPAPAPSRYEARATSTRHVRSSKTKVGREPALPARPPTSSLASISGSSAPRGTVKAPPAAVPRMLGRVKEMDGE